MKHVYPVRHPPVPDAAVRGELTPGEPALPPADDVPAAGRGPATPDQKRVGRDALRNATDGTRDTATGPVLDQVYNDKVAPDRGATPPRR